MVTKGDAQTNQIILRKQITTAGGVLRTSSSGDNLLIPLDGMIGFEIQLVALETTGRFNYATFITVFGAAKNIGGTPTMIGTWDYYARSAGGGGPSVLEDSSNIHSIQSINVSGTGASSYLIIEVNNNTQETSNFVAYVRYTQTLF